MNRLSIAIFPTLFVLTILLNCAQSNSHSRPPVTAVQFEPKKKTYRLGEALTIKSLTKLKEGTLENVAISMDGKLLLNSKSLENTININTKNFGVGKHIVKILATKKDGISGENYEEIFVASDTKPTAYSYQIMAEYPHNSTHFTQGFEFHDNNLYEGTGQEGSSAIYLTNYKNGSVIKEYKLDDQFFGEGITILNNKIYQLTYKTKIGFVYDLNSFKQLNTWSYRSSEGWGLTNNGKSLIMSDGTENIYFINPETFAEERKIQVCNEYNVINNINELEYIKGDIWANIWQTDTILIIDAETGKVKGEIDLKGLSGTIVQNQKEPIDVLNGIAWNPVTDKIYVTGKYWPKVFEIKLLKSTN